MTDRRGDAARAARWFVAAVVVLFASVPLVLAPAMFDAAAAVAAHPATPSTEPSPEPSPEPMTDSTLTTPTTVPSSSASSTADSDPGDDDDNDDVGAGFVVGAIAVMALIGVAAWWMVRRGNDDDSWYNPPDTGYGDLV